MDKKIDSKLKNIFSQETGFEFKANYGGYR